jgi:hypothetical protein
MDRLNFDDFASAFDDLIIDADELQNPSSGPDGKSLDEIARDDSRDEANDSSEFEVEGSDQ